MKKLKKLKKPPVELADICVSFCSRPQRKIIVTVVNPTYCARISTKVRLLQKQVYLNAEAMRWDNRGRIRQWVITW